MISISIQHSALSHNGVPHPSRVFCERVGMLTYPPASNLSASMGSIEAARRAGYSADKTAIAPSIAHASTPEVQVGIRPAKKSGIGIRLTSQHKPYAITI